MKRLSRKVYFCLASALFAGASALYGLEIPRTEWNELFPGIEHARFTVPEPLLNVNVLRIQTDTPGLSFYSTGPAPNHEADKVETDRRTVPDFLLENDLAVAVNANFYSPFNRQTRISRGPSNVKGLAISDGFLVSPPAAGHASFLVRNDGHCEVRPTGTDEKFENVAQAVSGSVMLLEDGKTLPQKNHDRHPRTLAGVSADGKTVWFVTIDGRQPGFSDGATFTECAEILQKLGADDGVNFDGGGSTTMVCREKDGTARVMNRPVGLGEPGTLRHNGNGIGIRLAPEKKE